MKSTKFVLSILSVFLLVAMLGVVSAQPALNLTKVNNPTTIQPGTELVLDLNLQAIGQDFAALDWSHSTTSAGTLTNPSLNSINSGEILPTQAKIIVPLNARGSVNVNITVSDAGINSQVLTYNLNIQNAPAFNINTPTSPISIGQNTTITLENTGNTGLSNIVLSEISAFGATFSSNNINLGYNTISEPITVILDALSNLKFGDNSITIQGKDITTNTIATGTINVQKSFCKNGPAGQNLTINRVRINNNGDGKDNDWELLDEIDVEVKVENLNQDEDVSSVIELGIFDSQGRNIANDMEYASDSDSDDQGKIDRNINNDDTETVHFRFKVPADVDTGSYKLAVKAYDDDEGESRSCTDSSSDLSSTIYESFSISNKDKTEDTIAIENIQLQNDALCGEAIRGSFDVFNVGKKDQDRVSINIYNSELGLNQNIEITNNFNKGDSESEDFSFTVPSNIKNGNYVIKLTPAFDYKSGNYREEGRQFTYALNVIGCSGTGDNGNTPIITANLGSDAVAGKDMTVTATIVNTGSTEQSYVIDALSYQSWAELSSINPRYLTLAPGQSGQAVINLALNSDADGSNSFVIQATTDGQIYTQTVQVNVKAGTSGGALTGLSIFNSGSNSLWLLILVNVILIVLIVVVAIRLSRR